MYFFIFANCEPLDQELPVNPRPTKGDGYRPLSVCLGPHKNAKESDPGHIEHLFYILCGHVDEKKKQGYPLRWG